MSGDDWWTEFWGLFDLGAWEPATKEWITSVVGPGDLFLDIGAWIGPTVQWAWETGAYVIAVEPDPVAFSELERRWGIIEEVELWEAALVDERPPGGVVHLAPNPRSGGGYGDSMSRIADGPGLAVHAFELDWILAGRVPKAVKIDVEGYEYVMLRKILPRLVHMKCEVQVSFHDENKIPLHWFNSFDFARRTHELDVVAGWNR